MLDKEKVLSGLCRGDYRRCKMDWPMWNLVMHLSWVETEGDECRVPRKIQSWMVCWHILDLCVAYIQMSVFFLLWSNLSLTTSILPRSSQVPFSSVVSTSPGLISKSSYLLTQAMRRYKTLVETYSLSAYLQGIWVTVQAKTAQLLI